ncbi:hypothetical protein TWF481_004552 [Arthrobotrys musiformis]|uniref:Apple domain-containing protein n=1 Tax=Arthrobotrys musiformis TaxID=47236 RepID=A0AAV9WJY6_9PEZI
MMKSFIIPNILLAVSILTTGVSGWYNEKSINVIQHCTTEYCNQNIHPPQTYIKTIHKTVKSTITITPKPSTRYVTKKDQTRTVTQKLTKTYTVTSKCSTRTVYATGFVTATKTVSQAKTVTISITVATTTPDSTTVPIPHGFISAGDDPDNQYSTSIIEKRDLEERHGKTSYPTSVKCTKTIQTINKHTITAKRPTATVTKPCKTKTITIRQTKKVTTTIYQQKPKTITITHQSTRTVTKTKTSTKTVTKGITAVAPRITTYFACGPHNHFQGPNGSVDVVVLPGDIEVPARIAYDCCSQCHAHVNSKGVPDCAGSFFRFGAVSLKGTCWLRLTDVCSYDTHEPFKFLKDSLTWVGQVGNGPCGRWKVQL